MAHIGQEAGLGGVGGFGFQLGLAEIFFAFLDGGEIGEEDDRAAFATSRSPSCAPSVRSVSSSSVWPEAASTLSSSRIELLLNEA